MFYEKFFKVIPAVVFLFCILEIFELVLIINDMNKTEKLEVEIRRDLNMLKDIMIHTQGMQLEHFKNKNKN
ncbi:hypothetical protein E5K82_06945 [Helicobacter pylori]|nr:hypothetical protein E5K82_06945 [Helicobacter pylori]